MKSFIKVFYSLILLFTCLHTYSQNISDFYLLDTVKYRINNTDKPLLDSVLHVYHNSKSEIVQLTCLNYLSDNLLSEDLWSQYARLIILTKKNSTSGEIYAIMANAINNIGLHEFFSGDNSLAEKYFFIAMKMDSLLKDFRGVAVCVDNLGHLYEKTGNIRSMEYYSLGIKLNELIGNYSGVAQSKNNLASQYLNINDDESYLQMNKEAAAIQDSIHDLKGLGNSYNNIGNYYLKHHDFKEAHYYIRKSLDIRHKINDISGEIYSYGNFGSVFLNTNQPDSAMYYYHLGLTNAKEIGNLEQEAYISESICWLYMQKKELDKALSYGYNSLTIGERLNQPEIKWRAADYLYQIYKLKKNATKALEMLELKNKARSVMNNLEIKKSIFKQQYKSEFEKKETILKANAYVEQEKIKAAASAAEKKRNVIILFTVLCLLFAVVFMLLIYRNLKMNKQKNKIITEQKLLVEEKNKEVMDSINYAKRIQQGILPDEKEIKEVFPNSFVLFLPKDIVSGDFYWFMKIHQPEANKNLAAIVAADCTGHGVPGAFMSMLNSSLLNQTSFNPLINTPAEALNFLNQELPKNLKSFDKNATIRDGMDLAFCLFDLTNNKMMFAGANNPCLIIRNNEISELKPMKQAITADESAVKKQYTDQEFIYHKNDCIYLFTDGYADQFGGPKGKKFKYKQLNDLLLSLSHLPMTEQKSKLEETFHAWRGDLEQVDDVLLIGIKI